VDNVTSLSASATGAEVGAVVERRMADVYYADLHAPGPTLANIMRLTGHSQSNFPHAWTPSGDGVVFENSNSGGSTICKQRLGAAKMELEAKLPEKAAMAEFTPDGKWMLFMEFIGWPSRVIGVFSIPAAGGTPQQLSVTGTIDEFHCPLASKGTCVMRETLSNKQFVFYALDPVRGMGPELGRMDWEPTTLGDWSISPDGSTVAMANHDPAHPGIQLATLSAGAAARTSSIPVLGFGTILEPTWSPDGKGLFVESKTVTGYDLLYVDLAGHVRLLRESPIPIWGVPSRDGRKLAFPAQTVSINVWVGPTALP
jgi:Tol biopolymer transport system component